MHNNERLRPITMVGCNRADPAFHMEGGRLGVKGMIGEKDSADMIL
jgi:hypothetical protein